MAVTLATPPAAFAPLQNLHPCKKQQGTPAAFAPNIDKDIDRDNISSPSAPPSIKDGHSKLKSPRSNGKLENNAFLEIIGRLIPFFLEKSGKLSYDLNSKPSGRSDSKKTRLPIILDSLKGLHQAIHAQHPETDKAALMEETESAARFIVGEFCKSDWHHGRNPKTDGKKYDDLAFYAFKDMGTVEKWLKW